jgi:tripartite-type tricarboxylate transporter receptor subunit TctC
MAVIRGEADVSCNHFESILDRIEEGELRPLLQITAERISPHPSLDGVPVLGGQEGLVVQRLRAQGHDPEANLELSAALIGMSGAGRLIVGPAGLDEDTARCLADSLNEVLSDPEFRAAAAKLNRSLDTAPAEEARRDVEAAAGSTQKLIPIIKTAIGRVRK